MGIIWNYVFVMSPMHANVMGKEKTGGELEADRREKSSKANEKRNEV